MYLRTNETLGRGYGSSIQEPYGAYLGGPTKGACPAYEKDEVRISWCQTGSCQQGHLPVDVVLHPRGLLIADFGVGWSGIKEATKKEKFFQDWIRTAKSDLFSIILRIIGFSDCVGAEKDNLSLRKARAQKVYELLGKDLQSRADFIGAAKAGEYIADNSSRVGRAKNRSVLIELLKLPEQIIEIKGTAPPKPCTGPGCKPPPPPPPPTCLGPRCPPPPPPPPPCVGPDCLPPPPPPGPTDTDPDWKPPRIPIPGLSIREILDRAKEVRDFLKRNNGDRGLLNRIEGLLNDLAPIVSLAGAVFVLYAFTEGKLVQVTLTSDLILQRILSRFESSGMKDALERILNELTDPKMTNEIQDQVRKTQPRDPRGRFQERQPGDDPPGSQHEKQVCNRVRLHYPYFAEQVRLKRYDRPIGLPGQPPPPGLVLTDPVAKVDCIGSRSPNSGLILFEAKDSGPADFTNPGLTAGQRIVYPALVQSGGETIISKGSFKSGTVLPKGTRVRIITPGNLDQI